MPSSQNVPWTRDRVWELSSALSAARWTHPGDTALSWGWVLDELVALEALDEPELISDLMNMAPHPAMLHGVERYVRSRPWMDGTSRGEVVRRLGTGQAGPVSWVLASLDADGRVRERAVRAMLTGPLPLIEAAPSDLRGWAAAHHVGSTWSPPNTVSGRLFIDPIARTGPVPVLAPALMLRTADPVPRIRAVARSGLVLRLAADPSMYLAVAVSSLRLVQERARGRFMTAQVRAALAAAHPAILESLAVAPDRILRRVVVEAGLAHRLWGRDRLLAFVAFDYDDVIIGRVAEALCRDAVWDGDVGLLTDLRDRGRAPARVAAVTGLLRAGQLHEAARSLNDRDARVRAVAQEAAHRCGIDVAAHYRTVAGGPSPTVGAVEGLLEVGGPADADLLRSLLSSTLPGIRMRAARLLRVLEARAALQARHSN
ncbi:hypothetical protein ACFO1B_10175 [Dactylosporangium siamense]|uniref:HEAT repeat domain-containing protein n=1 Tax=Dactylosporangium siamense TaxID=685454 RepID=A0A919UFW6_9ACTN|nr:hypothetical protein [Dactylosporangium siamense]GIG49063.1 hypothetical protein Dsi01nite_071040 [Dactylosporangium siamense]